MRSLTRRPRPGATLLLRGALLTAAACGAMATGARALRAQMLEIDRAGPSAVEAAGGSLITLPFRVTNRAARAAVADPRATAPSGWRVILATDTLRLAPGETAVRLVAVAVPARAQPGAYTVGLALPGPEDVRDSVLVRVVARAAVSLEHVDAPRFAVGGEPYQTTFRVTNEGNVALDLEVRGHATHGFPFRLDPPRLRLPPDGTRIVSVTVETSEVRSETQSNLRLVVAGGAAADTAVSSIAVLPRTLTAEREFHRLPATVTLRGAPVGGATPPVEVRGAGSLSAEGTDRLEFLLRGPGIGEPSAFGVRDEYRARYRTDRFDVQLGDQSFRLSSLTAPGHGGFGAAGSVDLGAVSLGGFHSLDRRSTVDREATGLYLAARPLAPLLLGLFGVTRTGLYDGDVVSGRADLELFPGFTVGGEVAGADDIGGGPRAGEIEARGRASRFTYDLRYLQADSTFPGPFAGLEYLSAGATVRPLSWLVLDGQYYDQRTRLPGSVRESGLAAVGLSLGSVFRLRIQRAAVDAPLAVVPTSRETDEVEAGVGLGMGPLRASITGTAGRLRDRLDPAADEDFYEGFGRVSTGLGLARLSGSLEYRNGLSLYDGDVDERWSARVEASLRFPATDVWVSAYGARRSGLATRESLTLDGVVRQRLPFGHELELRGYTTATWPGTFSRSIVVLNYRVPLGIPVRPLPLRGEVFGRLYDAATGTGLARVPVRLGGHTVVTDSEGAFRFRDLEGGDYYLQVENSGGAADRIPVSALPMEVTVGEGAPSRIEVGFVEPAVVEGRIRVFGFDPDAPLAERDRERIDRGGLAGMRIELRDGDVLRLVTDAEGRFRFNDLRPGRWTLRVIGGPIPAHHRLARDSVVLDLKAGGVYEAALRVEEQARPLILRSGGEVFVEPAPAAPDAAPDPAGARATSASVRYHVVTFEDRGLFDLARKLYGDVTLWPKILVANRDLLPDPDHVPAGLRLRIPPAAPLTAEERAARDAYYRDRPPG